MTTSTITVNESQAKEILDSISDEFYRAVDKTKKEYIKLAVSKLEEIDVPKKMIGGLLCKYLRFTSEGYIYEVIGPEYKRHFDKSEESGLIDDNKELEEDAKKVKEKYGITDDDIPDEATNPVVRTLSKKLMTIAKRCYYFENQYYHYKAMFEEGVKSGVITNNDMCHNVVTYADQYDELIKVMKKSPNGFETIHNGREADKFRTYKFKKPLIGVEN